MKSESLSTASCKLFGQPTHESHPHLLNHGEITPLISKQEYQIRRDKLVETLLKHAEKNCAEKQHVVCTFRIFHGIYFHSSVLDSYSCSLKAVYV